MSEVDSRSDNSHGDEIELRDLFSIYWQGRLIIAGVTLVALATAVVIVLMVPNIYRAEALLTPNDQEGAGSLSALASQYGGLASLAGLNLSRGRADKSVVGLGILTSRKFLSEFISRHDILVPLMASDYWDPVDRKLHIDSNLYDTDSKTWVRDVDPPKAVVPSAQEAYDEFMKHLSVDEDKKTGFVTIAVSHHSPEAAKNWVDWLIVDLNSAVLRQDVAEADLAIKYLSIQIDSTPLAGLRDVFFRLIEEQTKTILLANVSDEYVFKTIDPAVIPEQKSGPRRVLIVILAVLVGNLSGFIFVGMQNWSKNGRRLVQQ